MKIALAIPTYNAGNDFYKVLENINEQNEMIDLVRVVDSSSNDSTVDIAKKFGCEVEVIDQKKFSHGGTRRKIAIESFNSGYDYLIFMTQDVFLQENALKNLINYISSDKNLGVVFGKQEVDLTKGNLFEYYARTFNYSEKSYKRTKSDIRKFGIKTIFSSDAFAIYNLAILKEVDFFEDTKEVSEDMLAAHKIIEAGRSVGYCAEAKVYHTHNYKVIEEYKRYKEIGKFYKKQSSIMNFYGKTSNNGVKLAVGEVSFLWKQKKLVMIPKSLIRNAAKFIGHKVGYYFND